MSEKTTYRTPRDKPYFSINRATAQDSNLSFEARGLLAYLLSKPDDWKVIIADLQSNGGIGRDKVRRILNELQTAGYILKEDQTINPDGTFGNVEYRIYETKPKPCTENPSTVEPNTENPTQHNTESTEDRVTKKTLLASPDGNAEGLSTFQTGQCHLCGEKVAYYGEPLRGELTCENCNAFFDIPDGNAEGEIRYTINLWPDVLDKMVQWPDTSFEYQMSKAIEYLHKLRTNGKLTPDMDSTEVLAIVKRELALPDGAEADSPIEAKPEKPRNLIFDAIAVGSFGIEDVNGDKAAGARIGKITAWLKKQHRDLTPETVMAFYAWYDRENNNTARPRDVGKFAEHWLKWKAQNTKPAYDPRKDPKVMQPYVPEGGYVIE